MNAGTIKPNPMQAAWMPLILYTDANSEGFVADDALAPSSGYITLHFVSRALATDVKTPFAHL